MEWSSVLIISHLVLWAVVLVQVCLTLALARLVGQLMSRRFPGSGARVMDPGPEIGSAVESWEGTDLLGQPVRVAFPRDRGLFLLFISPHCTACASLLPSARRFFNEIADHAQGIWVMLVGGAEVQIRYAREQGLAPHPVVAEKQLPLSWRAGGGPYALWIDGGGRVTAKGMVNSREHLESLRNAAELGHPTADSFLAAQTEEHERRHERSANFEQPRRSP
jgi:methylamine dehydrogenase accessory protein MauD